MGLEYRILSQTHPSLVGVVTRRMRVVADLLPETNFVLEGGSDSRVGVTLHYGTQKVMIKYFNMSRTWECIQRDPKALDHVMEPIRLAFMEDMKTAWASRSRYLASVTTVEEAVRLVHHPSLHEEARGSLAKLLA